MGKLIMVKCNNCGFLRDDYRSGFTASYFQVQKHLIVLIRSCQYGYTWKSLLATDPTLKVDASFQLYQCPCCKQLVNTHCLNLYRYAKESYAPSSDEVLYFYKHLCPTCKKRMISIEAQALCPKCGKFAIVTMQFFRLICFPERLYCPFYFNTYFVFLPFPIDFIR